MRLAGLKGFRGRGGYALVVTIVMMVLVTTAAVGLVLSREMWTHFGQKQFHRVLTQTALDTRSLEVLEWVRGSLARTGTVEFSECNANFEECSRLSIVPRGDELRPVVFYTSFAVAMNSGSAALAPSFSLEMFYEEISGGREGVLSLSQWDPYQGVRSRVSGCGVMLVTEMGGEQREDKTVRPLYDAQGRFVGGSRLKAWSEADVVKIHDVVMRYFPVSALTFYGCETPGMSSVLELGHWAQGWPIGRYYVEGQPVAAARMRVTLDCPLVSTSGFFFEPLSTEGKSPGVIASQKAATWLLKMVSGSTSRVVSLPGAPLNRTQFLANRVLEYSGYFADGSDRPVRLLRVGNGQTGLVGAPQFMPLISEITAQPQSKNLLRQIWDHPLTVRVARDNPSRVVLRTSVGNPAGLSADAYARLRSAFSVDDARREIVFRPVGLDLGVRRLVVFVVSGGVRGSGLPLSFEERAQYRVRVLLDNVDGLGWSGGAFDAQEGASAGLTIASVHPIVLEDGFNGFGGGRVPAMLVAPQFCLTTDAPDADVPLRVRAVLVTRGGDDPRPLERLFFSHDAEPVPSLPVEVTGSVVFWGRSAGPLAGPAGAQAVGARLSPWSLVLGGAYPPLVPAVLDVRFGRERLSNYRLYSAQTQVNALGSDN